MIKRLSIAGVLISFGLLVACGQGTQENSDISGAWEGSISVSGIELDITVNFIVDDSGKQKGIARKDKWQEGLWSIEKK